MATQTTILFPPYRLDAANECVWLGPDAIVLTRKAFSVLRYLLENAGRMVSKDELLDAVWPETHVGEGVLKVAVAELRKALNDSSREPLYIETAHRRGYRFIGQIEKPGGGVTARGNRAVDREHYLARLNDWLMRAIEGDRQIVFLTGEAGIGKTTLVEAFLERAVADERVWIAHGQCLEHFGAGEPYLPILEAFTRLCRQPGRESLTGLLRRHAPTWLAEMPSLLTDADRELLRREILGGAKERMLREIAEAVEALTAETPLLLVLEDLHWCDYSTVDLIGYLARRRGPAKLLVIGTYRPSDVIANQHPLGALKRELQVRGQCAEMMVELLSASAVGKYLALRFPANDFPEGMAHWLYQRTDGNPLFLVNALDYLITQKQIVHRPDGKWSLGVPWDEIEIGIPDSLQHMIERQLELLSGEEQEMLSVASIAGLEFSTRTLAGAMGENMARLGARCHDLVRRRQFLRLAAMVPLYDGSVLERYGFIHGIYQRALYLRVPEPRRVGLHRALGEFQETAYAPHAREIAAELALHFQEGREYAKAVRYCQVSAENASRRYANREAIEHLDRALSLVEHSTAAELAERQGRILAERAAARRAMDDNVGAAADLERVVECAAAAGRVEWQIEALIQWSGVLFWIDHQRSLDAAERAVSLSSGLPEIELQARGYRASRRIRLQGWSNEDFQDLVAARAAAKRAGAGAFYALHNMSYSFFASYRSQGREACRAADEGMELALKSGDAFLYMSCQYFKAWALLFLGEWGPALALAREGIELSRKNGHETGESVLRMIEARLHLEALDFSRARDLALAALDQARPGFPRFVALIGLGEAYLGSGEGERALEVLEEVTRDSETGPFRLDWIFGLPLHRALSELRLGRGELARAREEARRLCGLAAGPGERTYLAQGHLLLARISLAEGDREDAGCHFADAMSAIEGVEAPLAEWRVYGEAAAFSSEQAAAYRARAAAAIERIAGSLVADEPLRRAFLGASPIRAIFVDETNPNLHGTAKSTVG